MAKVTGPLNSVEARGRVGALVYNTWRGLHTVKIHTDPATQFSDAQVYIRSLTAYCIGEWQGLSEVQYAAWRKYAEEHPDPDWSGSKKRLTGFNWFIRINVRRLLVDTGTSPFAPTISVQNVLSGIYTIEVSGALYVVWSMPSWASPGDYYVEAYLSKPHSSTRFPAIEDCKRDGFVVSTDMAYTMSATSGTWQTVYLRIVHTSGVVGSWQSARGYLS